MNRQLYLFFASFTLAMQTLTQSSCYADSCSECFGCDSVLTYDIGGGYRQDDIKWKVYPSSIPATVESEQWKKLQIGIIETNAQVLVYDNYLAKFDFDYGWFCDGGHQTIKAHDIGSTDLNKDLKADTRGHVYNIDGAIGYQFNLCSYRFGFTPLAGYSYHFQKLKNSQYHNELNDSGITAHNNYKLRWRGPTLGFTTFYQANCYLQFNFTYAYHWVRYRGKIAETFPTGSLFGEQKNNKASGNEFTVGSTYEFCPNWTLGLKVDYKIFNGNGGKFIPDGDNPADVDDSSLRGLKWTSLNATIDIIYIF